MKNNHYDQNVSTLALLDVKHTKISSTDSKPEFTVKLYGNHSSSSFFKLQPAENFIIAEINLSSLKLALRELKESFWWNVYGFFVIERIYLNSCHEAYEFLKIMWDSNILSAIFICMDFEFKIKIHTFNPYSDDAPDGWNKYRSIRQSNGHPLVLFKYHTELNGKFLTTDTLYTFFKLYPGLNLSS